MTRWQYYIVGSEHDDPRRKGIGLGRQDLDGETWNFQTLGRGTIWVRSEFLLRGHFKGFDDEYVKISEERAIEIIEGWFASGRLTRRPEEPAPPEGWRTTPGSRLLETLRHLMQRTLRRQRRDT